MRHNGKIKTGRETTKGFKKEGLDVKKLPEPCLRDAGKKRELVKKP